MLHIEDAWLVVEFTSKDHRLNHPSGGRWAVVLRGGQADLAELPHRFTSDELRVAEQGGRFYLDARRIDDQPDPERARQLAQEAVDLVNGTSALLLEGAKPVELESLSTKIGEGKFLCQNHVAEIAEWREPILPSAPGVDAETGNRLVALAQGDPAVARALQILGSDPRSPVVLYKVFEVIRDDVGGEKALRSFGWVSGKQLSTFTSSVNNPSVMGDHARHASDKQTPPRSPMDRPQAARFIRQLVISWLNWRAGGSSQARS